MIDHNKEYKQKFINDEKDEEARKRGNIIFPSNVNAKKQLNEKNTYGNKIRLLLDQKMKMVTNINLFSHQINYRHVFAILK